MPADAVEWRSRSPIELPAADPLARRAAPIELNLSPWKHGSRHRPVVAGLPWAAGWWLCRRKQGMPPYSKSDLLHALKLATAPASAFREEVRQEVTQMIEAWKCYTALHRAWRALRRSSREHRRPTFLPPSTIDPFKQMTDDVSPTNTPQTSNSEDEAKHTEPSSSKDTRSEFPLPVERTFIHFQIYPTCQRRSSSVPTRGRSGSM